MAELLRDGLVITVVGMGLVFAALALLWGVMAAMHRLFPLGREPYTRALRRRREAVADAATEMPATTTPAPAQVGPKPEELAAIVTALARWRQEEASEDSIGWRLPPLLTRWTAVGRGRQVQSWSPPR